MKQRLKIVGHIYKEYRAQDCFNLSAALSFYAVLSLLPILLIVISVVGHYVGKSEVFITQISDLLDIISPAVKEGFVQNLKNIVEQKEAFGGIGILFLLWTAHFMFSNLEKTLNRLLHSPTKRHFLLTRLFFLLFLIGIAIFLLAPSWLQLFMKTLVGWGIISEPKLSFGGNSLFFVSSWISFLMIILLVPSKRVPVKYAALGGVLFAAFLFLARVLFRYYTLHFINRYNVVYGSLTALILGALWIFYFSNILLVCTLLVGQFQKKN